MAHEDRSLLANASSYLHYTYINICIYNHPENMGELEPYKL